MLVPSENLEYTINHCDVSDKATNEHSWFTKQVYKGPKMMTFGASIGQRVMNKATYIYTYIYIYI